MGVGAEAPCTPWGRLRAVDNVWIADASVFPSAGDRHPTLTVSGARASRCAGYAATPSALRAGLLECRAATPDQQNCSGGPTAGVHLTRCMARVRWCSKPN